MPLVVSPPVSTDTVRPEDYNLLAWNWDPTVALTSTTTRLNTAGRLNTWRIATRRPMSVTNIHLHIVGTPTALTSGQCGVALYSSAGSLLGSLVTGVDTAWGTTGFKTHALSGGPFQTDNAGAVIVAAWYNGTTAPAVLAGFPVSDINLATTGLNLRQALADTSRTTSAPATLGTRTSSGTIPFWCGIS